MYEWAKESLSVVSKFQETGTAMVIWTLKVYADNISHKVEALLAIVLTAIMLPHEKELDFLCPHTSKENKPNDGPEYF